MFTLFASTMFDIYLGVEMLFVTEETGAVETVLPGRPSVGTMVAFMLVATAGFLAMVRPARLPAYLLFLDCLILLTGVVALIGYAFDLPALYYYVPGGISTAMAFHTAALFALLGIGFIRLR